MLSLDLDGKRQDLLAEAVPGASRIATLADLTTTPQRHLEALQSAARGRGLELSILGVSKREDIGSAIDGAEAAGAKAVNVLSSPMLEIMGAGGLPADVEACRVAEVEVGLGYAAEYLPGGGGYSPALFASNPKQGKPANHSWLWSN